MMKIPALRVTQALADNPPLTDSAYWDRQDQLWRDRETRQPLVDSVRCHSSSVFGETTMTKTDGEGSDQSALAGHLASPWGETSITKTRGEGSEQSTLASHLASSWGETSITRTRGEGSDQSGLASQAEHTSSLANIAGTLRTLDTED